MKTLILSLILISASSAVHAQNLTPAQKEADFRYLASLYSTYYAPIDWKKQLFNFDALAIQPWLDRVRCTGDDAIRVVELLGPRVEDDTVQMSSLVIRGRK